jgi:hypothetical protein
MCGRALWAEVVIYIIRAHGDCEEEVNIIYSKVSHAAIHTYIHTYIHKVSNAADVHVHVYLDLDTCILDHTGDKQER